MNTYNHLSKKAYSIEDLEDLLDAIPHEISLKDEHNNYIYMNKAFAEKFRISKDEISSTKNKNFSPKNHRKVFSKIEKYVITKKTPILMKKKIMINNEKKYYEYFKSPLAYTGKKSKWLVTFARDITSDENIDSNIYNNLKNNPNIVLTEEELTNDIYLKKEFDNRMKAESELELFLKTATDLCGVITCQGELVKASSNWTRVLGWEAKDLFYLDLHRITHNEDIDTVNRYLYNCRTLKKGSGFICRLRCKNGDYKIIEWNWSYCSDKDNIVITGKDRTEEKKLEEDKKLLEDAIALENLKTEFLANISHEFRTPINIILTGSQLINSKLNECEFSSDCIGRHIKSIRQSSYRLLRLVNNLLDITKLESGFATPNLVNCNIITLIEDIVLSIADHIGSTGRNITFDTSDEEVFLACDPEYIETIILNLLSNAVKFTETEGNIFVNLTTDDDLKKIFISIKDDGIKIDKTQAKIIFNRFLQTDNLLNRSCEGTGLGLAIVKSLVELLGGEIWVNTDIETGAEFIFYLPIMKVKEINHLDLSSKIIDAKIERFNIEFSDIYSI